MLDFKLILNVVVGSIVAHAFWHIWEMTMFRLGLSKIEILLNHFNDEEGEE